MKKTLNFSFIDLENFIYPIWNRIQDLIEEGILNNEFITMGYLIKPCINLLEETLNSRGITQVEQYIFAKEDNYLIWKDKIHPSNHFIRGRNCCQGADICLCKQLRHFRNTKPVESAVVIASGDGGYINSLKELAKLGHPITLISLEWCLNRAYYENFDERDIITLDDSWVMKLLPHSMIRSNWL